MFKCIKNAVLFESGVVGPMPQVLDRKSFCWLQTHSTSNIFRIGCPEIRKFTADVGQDPDRFCAVSETRMTNQKICLQAKGSEKCKLLSGQSRFGNSAKSISIPSID